MDYSSPVLHLFGKYPVSHYKQQHAAEDVLMLFRAIYVTPNLQHGLHVKSSKDVVIGVFLVCNIPDIVCQISGYKIQGDCQGLSMLKILLCDHHRDINVAEGADRVN